MLIQAYYIDVNKKSNNNRTLLHIAAQKGCTEACELLLDNDADVNAKDNDGRTPLDVALTDEIKQLLRDHGAKHGSELEQRNPENN